MSKQPEHQTCPDCKGDLKAIKLLDKWGAVLERKVFEELRYASGDAEPQGVFVESYKPEGTVRAMMCTSCRRIYLYG